MQIIGDKILALEGLATFTRKGLSVIDITQNEDNDRKTLHFDINVGLMDQLYPEIESLTVEKANYYNTLLNSYISPFLDYIDDEVALEVDKKDIHPSFHKYIIDDKFTGYTLFLLIHHGYFRFYCNTQLFFLVDTSFMNGFPDTKALLTTFWERLNSYNNISMDLFPELQFVDCKLTNHEYISDNQNFDVDERINRLFDGIDLITSDCLDIMDSIQLMTLSVTNSIYLRALGESVESAEALQLDFGMSSDNTNDISAQPERLSGMQIMEELSKGIYRIDEDNGIDYSSTPRKVKNWSLDAEQIYLYLDEHNMTMDSFQHDKLPLIVDFIQYIEEQELLKRDISTIDASFHHYLEGHSLSGISLLWLVSAGFAKFLNGNFIVDTRFSSSIPDYKELLQDLIRCTLKYNDQDTPDLLSEVDNINMLTIRNLDIDRILPHKATSYKTNTTASGSNYSNAIDYITNYFSNVADDSLRAERIEIAHKIYNTLSDTNGMTVTEILKASELNVSTSVVTSRLHSLTKGGYVTRNIVLGKALYTKIN